MAEEKELMIPFTINPLVFCDEEEGKEAESPKAIAQEEIPVTELLQPFIFIESDAEDWVQAGISEFGEEGFFERYPKLRDAFCNQVEPQNETGNARPNAESQPPFVPAEAEQQPDKIVRKVPTVYQLSRRMLEKFSFKTVKGLLFCFNTVIYEQITKDEALKMIMANCRKEIEQIGTPSAVSQIYEFIRIEPKIVDNHVSINQHLLAFRNGVLNLVTGNFEPPTPNYFLTSCLNIEYMFGANAHCPNFEHYVTTIANGDQALYARIWEVLGYLLTQDMRAKAFVFLYGPSDTGKSVFGKFISSFFPSEAISNIDLYKLGERFSLSGLVGKRLNLCLDLPSGKLKSSAVSNLKMLTGGDSLTAEAKFANAYSFENTCKLVFASNHKLVLPEKDEAFENRVVAIPFTTVIPKEQQNKEILQAFEREKLAIVLKALQYYKKLVNNNYQFSGTNYAVLGAETEIIRDVYDSIKDFLDNCCRFIDPAEGGTFTFILHEAYRKFCEESECTPCHDMKQFSKILHLLCDGKVIWKKWRDRRFSSRPEGGYMGIMLL